MQQLNYGRIRQVKDLPISSIWECSVFILGNRRKYDIPESPVLKDEVTDGTFSTANCWYSHLSGTAGIFKKAFFHFHPHPKQTQWHAIGGKLEARGIAEWWTPNRWQVIVESVSLIWHFCMKRCQSLLKYLMPWFSLYLKLSLITLSYIWLFRS